MTSTWWLNIGGLPVNTAYIRALRVHEPDPGVWRIQYVYENNDVNDLNGDYPSEADAVEAASQLAQAFDPASL